MKKIAIVVALIAIVFIFYDNANADVGDTVFETTGWIIDEGGYSYEFTADVAPYTYSAIITDLSVGPAFDLIDIFLSISTNIEVIDFIYGEGQITFTAIPGKTYFANVFARGAGDMETGNFGLKIITVADIDMDDILEFFDESVTDGTLTGDGPGKSANGRLNALENMLETAGDLIDLGDIEGACEQLKAASRKCDGDSPPPDFVAGSAASELYDMILELIAELGCE